MAQIDCFVACAFGREDVDQLYDKAIAPVLTGASISVHRVDREEHNQDIDDKIMELIKTCHFCIADLTYARPSVYYEAGVCTGLGKPVIYSSRKDHLNSSPKDDPEGNRRVHFDLQMKNIIEWSSPERLTQYSDRLRKRIAFVAAPILEALEQTQALAEAAAQFSMLSKGKRIEMVKGLLTGSVLKKGYRKVEPNFKGYTEPYGYPAYKKGRKLLALFVLDSGTKAEMKWIHATRIVKQNDRSLRSRDECHVVIASLASIPQSRIESLYPHIQKVDRQAVTYRGEECSGVYPYYHFLSAIKSPAEFEGRLGRLLKEPHGI